jgi:hypothetical protein
VVDRVCDRGGDAHEADLAEALGAEGCEWIRLPDVPPMIWLRAVFSLRMRPASIAVVIRATRMSPRSSSTRTSTNFAANGADRASSAFS